LLPAAVLRQRRFSPSWALAMSPVGRSTPCRATPSCKSSRHGTPFSHCSRAGSGTSRSRHRRVRFASPAVSVAYEITPYEEFYGLHPSQFNFDAMGTMTPLSPDGMMSPIDLSAPSPRVSSPNSNASGKIASVFGAVSPPVEMIPSPGWGRMDIASSSSGAPKAGPGSLLWVWRQAASPRIGTPCIGVGTVSPNTSQGSPSTRIASSTLAMGFGAASPLAGLARSSLGFVPLTSIPSISSSELDARPLASYGLGEASPTASCALPAVVNAPLHAGMVTASVVGGLPILPVTSPLAGTPLAAIQLGLGLVSPSFRGEPE